ncbi:MAG: heavy-metal-associated domain-containing protein [Gallintestinimicrobium sp.]
MRIKKLDGPVIGKKTVKISGMHCDHCVRAVTEAINKIDGVSAKVNLKKKEAVVSYEKVVEDAAIREAVEKAGYTVQSIQG